MKKLFLLSALILSALVVSGCGSTSEKPLVLEKGASAQNLLEKGLSLMKKDRDKARSYFRQVVQIFANTSYAAEAKYQLGVSYYQQKGISNYTIAAQEFSDFVNTYPSHPLAPQAQLYLAQCYINMLPKPGRDQANTRSAQQELKKLKSSYPLTPQAKEADAYLAKVENLLGDDLFLVANFYVKTHAWKAAVKRLQQMIDLYPSYSKNDRVYFLMAKSLFKMREFTRGQDYVTLLQDSYPKSPWTVKGKKLLEQERKKPYSKPAQTPPAKT